MNKRTIKEYFFITIGIILVAISVEYFFAPNNLAAGGVTGLAIVVNKFIPSINVSLITLIVNMVLFIVAFILIGGDFGGKTLFATIGLSIVMWIMVYASGDKSAIIIIVMKVTNLLNSLYGYYNWKQIATDVEAVEA